MSTQVLSESKGNILEDVSAIQILSEAKVVSNEIQEKQVIADDTQAEIDAARAGYAACGAYNSVLFFCIRDLASVDPMYQYSLSWFIKLFVRSIEVPSACRSRLSIAKMIASPCQLDCLHVHTNLICLVFATPEKPLVHALYVQGSYCTCGVVVPKSTLHLRLPLILLSSDGQ
jgi:hypothetical protein